LNDLSLHNTTFSHEFCLKWSSLLKELYHYKFDNGFAVIKNLTGKVFYSYLPIISYTDIPINEAIELSQNLKSRNYQIRVLNFSESSIPEGSPVTLRIQFEGLSFEQVKNNFSNRLKRYLNNSDFSDFEIESGKKLNLIDSFYLIYQNVMYRHGTPPLPKKLFFLLFEYFDVSFYIVKSKKHKKNISAACVLKDNSFSWIPWSGTMFQNELQLAGHFLYYSIIKESYENKDKFFDFGRSAYLSSNYEFKRRWGAVPIKIEIITNKISDLYKKYKFASKVWKKIPSPIANFIGPRICKYLIDL
jgi:hypothetical protein